MVLKSSTPISSPSSPFDPFLCQHSANHQRQSEHVTVFAHSRARYHRVLKTVDLRVGGTSSEQVSARILSGSRVGCWLSVPSSCWVPVGERDAGFSVVPLWNRGINSSKELHASTHETTLLCRPYTYKGRSFSTMILCSTWCCPSHRRFTSLNAPGRTADGRHNRSSPLSPCNSLQISTSGAPECDSLRMPSSR